MLSREKHKNETQTLLGVTVPVGSESYSLNENPPHAVECHNQNIVEDIALQTVSSSDGLRVLIVDDSLPIQKGLKRLLQAHGVASVKLAGTGKAGLELLQREAFDLVFIDFLMVSVE